MLFYKPLVSLVVAFAAARNVAASVAPVPRGNNGGHPPPPVQPIYENECNTGPVKCCDTYTSANNPLVFLLTTVLGIVADPALGVGLSCLNVIGGNQCYNDPVCCTNVTQSGLVNVGCTPINVNA